jgi:hypothetical protein
MRPRIGDSIQPLAGLRGTQKLEPVPLDHVHRRDLTAYPSPISRGLQSRYNVNWAISRERRFSDQ